MSDSASTPAGTGGAEPGGRVGVLDDELEDQLVIFDERVLEARRKVLEEPGAPDSEPSEDVAFERQRPGGEAGGAAVVATTGGDSPEGTEGEPSEDEEPSSDAEPAPPEPSSGGGQTPERTETMVASGQVPDDIPDGQDDDIVARQLRELAMSETDPELREKYWDEYRRYKEGTR